MPTYYPPGARKGNRFYVVRGWIEGIGERECRTDARDKRGAKSAWIRYAAFIRERHKPREDAGTFAGVADDYMTAKRVSANDRRYIERLKKDEIGKTAIVAVKQETIALAAVRLYPKATNATLNRQAYTPAAAVLHWAADNQLRDYIRVRKLKESEPETRRPTVGVPKLLLANTEGDEKRLLTVLLFQGLRIGEALSLDWGKVDLNGRLISVFARKVKRWKSVPMHDAVLEELAAVPEERRTGLVFPWKARWRVYEWLTPLCRRLRVRFTPHMARHEFGGSLREKGATARDLTDVGTWLSTKSVGRYDYAGTDHARDIIKRIEHGRKHG